MRCSIRLFFVVLLSSFLGFYVPAEAKDKKGGRGGGGAAKGGGGGGGAAKGGGGGGGNKPKGGGNAGGPKHGGGGAMKHPGGGGNAGGQKMAGGKKGGDFNAKPNLPKSLVKRLKRDASAARNTARPIPGRDPRRIVYAAALNTARNKLNAQPGSAVGQRQQSMPKTARFDARREAARLRADVSRVRRSNSTASNSLAPRVAGDMPSDAQKNYSNTLHEKRQEANEFRNNSQGTRKDIYRTNNRLAKLDPNYAADLAKKRAEEAKYAKNTRRENEEIWRLRNKIARDPNDSALYQQKIDKIIAHKQQQKEALIQSREQLQADRKAMIGDPKVDALKNRLRNEFGELREEKADLLQSRDDYKTATQALLNQNGGGK